jgi:hypothetical protein
VLQRCIDHASQEQQAQLVNEIIKTSLVLVQDPFGNYVVQYVLDLGNPVFEDNLIRQFVGHVCELSVQKFSSNVIEKVSSIEYNYLKIYTNNNEGSVVVYSSCKCFFEAEVD